MKKITKKLKVMTVAIIAVFTMQACIPTGIGPGTSTPIAIADYRFSHGINQTAPSIPNPTLGDTATIHSTNFDEILHFDSTNTALLTIIKNEGDAIWQYYVGGWGVASNQNMTSETTTYTGTWSQNGSEITIALSNYNGTPNPIKFTYNVFSMGPYTMYDLTGIYNGGYAQFRHEVSPL